MTRVIVEKLVPKKLASRKTASKKSSKAPPTSIVTKNLHRPSGERVRILSIDANSPTFGNDLSIVFRRNVAKARRENTKKFGSPDRVSKKPR